MVSQLYVSLVRIWARAGQTVLCSLVLMVLFRRLLRLILDRQQADNRSCDVERVPRIVAGCSCFVNNCVIYPWKWRKHIWSVPLEILSDILTKDRRMAPISIVWRLCSVRFLIKWYRQTPLCHWTYCEGTATDSILKWTVSRWNKFNTDCHSDSGGEEASHFNDTVSSFRVYKVLFLKQFC